MKEMTILEYGQIKDGLFLDVVSIKGHEELLKQVPHKLMKDMAILYRSIVGEDEHGFYTCTVTNEYLKMKGISKAQLEKDATKNATKMNPIEYTRLGKVLSEMMGVDLCSGEDYSEKDDMFVVSNLKRFHGAGVIAYPKFMEHTAKLVGGDFYILPSSIHEVLIVNDVEGINPMELKELVKLVNTTELSPEERLTDNAYHYDSKNHLFETVDEYKERMSLGNDEATNQMEDIER